MRGAKLRSVPLHDALDIGQSRKAGGLAARVLVPDDVLDKMLTVIDEFSRACLAIAVGTADYESAVRFAAMIPAIRAVPRTSPSRSAAGSVGRIQSIAPERVCERKETMLPPRRGARILRWSGAGTAGAWRTQW